MVHEKWFISDTHFFHTNMLKFTKKDGHRVRPFNSIDEMHELIAKNWNSRVHPQDYIYHLGDVTFQYHRPFQELMWSLNGHKRLIVGNHDKLKQEGLLKHFDKVELWRGFKEYDFTLTHIPMMLDRLRDGKFNVHGHTHETCLDNPHYINVCVEVRDYTPVHLDEILEEIKDANSKFSK